MNLKSNTLSEHELQLICDVVDETPAVVGYIDNLLYYRYANKAYLDWFGKTSTQVVGRHMLDVLGPIYYANYPHTMAALEGLFQKFERKFSLPSGDVRYGIVNYKPHIVSNIVKGFFVLVVDVTELKNAQLQIIEANTQIEYLAKRDLETLHSSNEVLERLCSMGQSLTSFLDFDSISLTLNRFINELLGDWCVDVYVLNIKRDALLKVNIGADNQVEWLSIDGQCESSTLFDCIDQNKIVVLNDARSMHEISAMEFTKLACPMFIGNMVFGVVYLSLNGFFKVDQRFSLILKTLCGYAASAFRNSMLYVEVKKTQKLLVEQEKMNALSAIVGGVSHKINTPLGNCILTSSLLKDNNNEMVVKLNDGSLSKASLYRHFYNSIDSIVALEKGLLQVSELVDKFKGAIVLSAEERVVKFNLYECCNKSLELLFINNRHKLELCISKGIEVVSYPNAVGHIVYGLAINSLQHAFEGRVGGVVEVSATIVGGNRLVLVFKDNGLGISECLLQSIFDPFFTTKMSSEYGGLGLSKIYFLVTKVLKGNIKVDSAVGVGTSFTINAPLNVEAVIE